MKTPHKGITKTILLPLSLLGIKPLKQMCPNRVFYISTWGQSWIQLQANIQYLKCISNKWHAEFLSINRRTINPRSSYFLCKKYFSVLKILLNMSVMTAKISATNIYGVNVLCLYYTFLCNITLPWCRRYIETQCTKLNVQHWLLLTNMSASNDKWVQTFRQEIHIFIWTGDMILHV